MDPIGRGTSLSSSSYNVPLFQRVLIHAAAQTYLTTVLGRLNRLLRELTEE